MSEERTYRQAITEALAAELSADETVFILGEDVGAAGGAFKATDGLMERFGPGRVLDTPISEQAIIGTAIGASIRGLRPVAEIMFADFAGVCYDQIANQVAKYRYMTGGQVSLPLTIRLANGLGGGFGAQHSQPVENWFLNHPGLKIAVPATAGDAYSLLRAAIRDPDPVLFFEHKGLFNLKGSVNDGNEVQLGVAEVVRGGEDVTVVATQQMRHRSAEAAEIVQDEGISAELIDPRTLVPFDWEAVAESVTKTNRLVVVQEGSENGSWGASLVARVAQELFDMLDAPPQLVSSDSSPIPAGRQEELWAPSAERIAHALRGVRG